MVYLLGVLFPKISELGFFGRGSYSVYQKAGKGWKPAFAGNMLWARQLTYMIVVKSQDNPGKVGIFFSFHR